MTARGAQAYYRTQVQSQSPLELVVMLYDGALRFMNRAAEAIEQRDLVAKRDAISRSMAILAELQNSLNMDAGGDIARQLDSLYTYMNERMLEANMKGSADPVRESIRLMTVLRTAWAEIATPAPQAEAVQQ
jgi:flagellar protein FliS